LAVSELEIEVEDSPISEFRSLFFVLILDSWFLALDPNK